MARRRYIPNMVDIEIKPFSQIAPTSGFFTYGEFYHTEGHNQLLNQSLTLELHLRKIHQKILLKRYSNRK